MSYQIDDNFDEFTDEEWDARPTVGVCDACGGDQDKILPDGICMPCSISWEFHRTNQPTETNQ